MAIVGLAADDDDGNLAQATGAPQKMTKAREPEEQPSESQERLFDDIMGGFMKAANLATLNNLAIERAGEISSLTAGQQVRLRDVWKVGRAQFENGPA
jgi:hypothetical protein